MKSRLYVGCYSCPKSCLNFLQGSCRNFRNCLCHSLCFCNNCCLSYCMRRCCSGCGCCSGFVRSGIVRSGIARSVGWKLLRMILYSALQSVCTYCLVKVCQMQTGCLMPVLHFPVCCLRWLLHCCRWHRCGCCLRVCMRCRPCLQIVFRLKLYCCFLCRFHGSGSHWPYFLYSCCLLCRLLHCMKVRSSCDRNKCCCAAGCG